MLWGKQFNTETTRAGELCESSYCHEDSQFYKAHRDCESITLRVVAKSTHAENRELGWELQRISWKEEYCPECYA